jgi:hypothetical protein
MGVSSVIAILVILVLVVFAALSITTSKADLTLSQKTADGVQAFYAADGAAEERMAEVAAAIEASPRDWAEALGDAYTVVPDGTGGKLIQYTEPIDEHRDLVVELRAAPNGALTRKLWQVVSSGDWTADTGLDLYIPEQG